MSDPTGLRPWPCGSRAREGFNLWLPFSSAVKVAGAIPLYVLRPSPTIPGSKSGYQYAWAHPLSLSASASPSRSLRSRYRTRACSRSRAASRQLPDTSTTSITTASTARSPASSLPPSSCLDDDLHIRSCPITHRIRWRHRVLRGKLKSQIPSAGTWQTSLAAWSRHGSQNLGEAGRAVF